MVLLTLTPGHGTTDMIDVCPLGFHLVGLILPWHSLFPHFWNRHICHGALYMYIECNLIFKLCRVLLSVPLVAEKMFKLY